MRFFLTIRPIQLFLLLMMPIIVSIIVSEAFPPIVVSFLNMLFYALFLGWIYSVGNEFGNRLNNKTFSAILFNFSTISTFFFCFIASFYETMEGRLVNDFGQALLDVFAIVALMSVFYCFYYVSKVLVSVEKNRNVRFNEHRLEIFLFFFIIVGLWLLQPRIRKIMLSKDIS